MEPLLRTGLTNALLAGLLAVLAFAASWLLRRRPAVVHALWLLVLVKLVTPPLVGLPIWPAPTPAPQPPPEPAELVFTDELPEMVEGPADASAEEVEPPPPPTPWPVMEI